MTKNNAVTKKIGILTSGGDAPGMNAAIRAIVLSARNLGYDVVGIKDGYRGLVYDNMELLHERNADNIIEKSGSFLYSDRCDKFATAEGLEMAYQCCIKNNIVGLITIGGDGTLSGATEFSAKYGIPCIGIPGTIDNDLVTSDYTIGFDTALNTVVKMADNLRHTCDSHRRCNIIQVMGRGAGDIALYSGIASGAQAILLKEIYFEKEKAFGEIISRLEKCRREGKHNFIIVLAEGIALDLIYGKEIGNDLRDAIQYQTGVTEAEEIQNNPALLDQFNPELENKRLSNTDPKLKEFFRVDYIETKYVSLEHTVRGGIPTLRDRQIASLMGVYAVKILDAGKRDRVVCITDDKIVDYDIKWALAADKQYKVLLIEPYYQAGLLNGEGIKAYEKALKRYVEFTKGMAEEEVAKIHPFCENKLAQFREVYKTAQVLFR